MRNEVDVGGVVGGERIERDVKEGKGKTLNNKIKNIFLSFACGKIAKRKINEKKRVFE